MRELRCAYCHEPSPPLRSCSGCGTHLHPDCWVDAARCPTLGCETAGGSPSVAAPTSSERTSNCIGVTAAVPVTIVLVGVVLPLLAQAIASFYSPPPPSGPLTAHPQTTGSVASSGRLFDPAYLAARGPQLVAWTQRSFARAGQPDGYLQPDPPMQEELAWLGWPGVRHYRASAHGAAFFSTADEAQGSHDLLVQFSPAPLGVEPAAVGADSLFSTQVPLLYQAWHRGAGPAPAPGDGGGS